MSSPPSIRQRLASALLGISLVWIIAVSAAVWLSVDHEVNDLLDGALQESAEILYGLLAYERLPRSDGESLPAPAHDERLVWQLVGGDGNVQLRSHRAPAQPLAVTPSVSSGRNNAGIVASTGPWRVYAMPFDAAGRTLFVAQAGALRSAARYSAAGLAAGVAVLIGLGGALWLRARVRNELAPITRMSDAVARFDPLAPGERLSAAERAELLPMHDAISGLAHRLAKTLANERAFSAHAAHALRTPLAGMVAQLAVAQRQSPADVQPRLQRMREAASRLQRVVTALLTLFRSGTDPKRQPVFVCDLVAQVPFESLAIRCVQDAPLVADPDLLAAALLNLLDNSQRHHASQATLEVTQDEGGARIVVHDDGDGISDLQREQLQQALDAQDYESRTGLGLMLADLIARAHDGRLQLLPVGKGFAVALTIRFSRSSGTAWNTAA